MAKRLHFIAAYTYTPSAQRRVSTKYLAGKRYLVTEECAIAAIAAGKAQLAKGRQPSGPKLPLAPKPRNPVRARRAKVQNR